MKQAPDVAASPDIAADSQRMRDALTSLGRRVTQDMEDRASWVQAREHWFKRRYCLEWRNPQVPWPGSSNIVLPLIDKKCDEMKPQYVNLVASAKPPVTARAAMPRYQKKTKSVELWYEWLVHHGSPNFIEETTLGVDDCLETGRCIIKDYWRYETRQSPTTLTSSRLPAELRRLIVSQSEKDANKLFIAGGGQGGAVVLTKREFDQQRDQIQKVVEYAFDLDHEERRDQKAIETILSWFRAGAKGECRFESRDVVMNVPAIQAIHPIDFIVPDNATDNIEDHERIAEVMYFTASQLKAAAIDQKFEKSAVDALFDKRRKGGDEDGSNSRGFNWQKQLISRQQATKEGLAQDTESDLFEVWKISTRMSLTEGAPEKKVQVWVPRESMGTPLKFKVHSRASGSWGYHTYTFELNKRRWYSPRGIPEKLDDLDAEMTAQHRAKLNAAAISNSLTFKAKPNRNYNVSNWGWRPGQIYFTNDPIGDLVPVSVPSKDISFDSEVQQLRVWAESYLGGPDYGLSDQSNLSEARTATEIQAIQSQARQSLSMRGLLFQRCYQGIYKEMLNEWIERGPDEVYIQVTGGDEPIRLTKSDLQGQYAIQCTGTIGSSDPVLEAQKAQNRIIMLAQLKPLLEPKYALDLGEAVIDWMEKDDIRLVRRVIRERSPEEIQQIQEAQQQALAQQQQQELSMAQAGAKPHPLQSGMTGTKSSPAMSTLPSIPPIGSRN